MAKVHTLTDTFASADAGKWVFGAHAAVAGGRLELACAGDYAGNATSLAAYDLTGSSLTVELVQAANAGNGTTETMAGLWTNTSRTDGVWMDVIVGLLRPAYTVGGGGVYAGDGVAYNPTAHRWLRIREAAGTVYWEASPDRATWTGLATWTAAINLSALQVILMSGHFGAEDAAGTAIFDNVNVDGASVAAVPVGYPLIRGKQRRWFTR